ncbi:MAG: hypothetical protein JEZ06_11360 [Anaerolineaceae bacterium]|nr:hypothetical protein [Anaerolineaceae bacterium]
MRKMVLLFIVGIMVLGCRTLFPSESPDNNVCYSELNLTDEECRNTGTHEYSSPISIEGIGGIDCTSVDGSYISDYRTYTFSFLKNNQVNYSHPSELIWDQNAHTFSEIERNTYRFTETYEDTNHSWVVTFEPWGFHEELEFTYECVNGTCGCLTSADYDIKD